MSKKLMTTEEVKAKFAALEEIKIHKATKMEYVAPFPPLVSRLYDKGVATLEDGRKVEIAWKSYSLAEIQVIHSLDMDREFVQGLTGWYSPVLKESEK